MEAICNDHPESILTSENTKRILSSILLDNIYLFVKLEFDVDDIAVRSKSRKGELVFCRQCFSKIARENTQSSLTMIGDCVGQDHSTIIHSCKVIQDYIDTKHEKGWRYGIIEKKIKGKIEKIKKTIESQTKIVLLTERSLQEICERFFIGASDDETIATFVKECINQSI